MSKHTPGPWSSTESSGGYRRKPYHVIRGPAPVSRRIARVEADTPHDALLIAAAPDLLAACKEAQRTLRNVVGNWPQQTLDALDAAIAKATGEKP